MHVSFNYFVKMLPQLAYASPHSRLERNFKHQGLRFEHLSFGLGLVLKSLIHTTES